MVLFQPGGPPSTVWEFGFEGFPNSQMIEVILWIAAVVAIIFALLLLSSYFNSRKPEHFYWGMSFALLWVNLHLVIFRENFEHLLEPVPAALAALTVGLLAVGLFKNVKPEQKLIGKLLLYYVLIMSAVILVIKNPGISGPGPFAAQPDGGPVPTWVVPIVVMALHVPSAVLIVYLPITTRQENGNSIWLMVAAGVIMGLVGLLLGLATVYGYTYPFNVTKQVVIPNNYTLIGYLFIALSIVPFALLFATIAFAWGTFVPKRWAFDIAGIELE